MSGTSGKGVVAHAAFVVWKSWYSVLNDELDEHHKTILSIINRVYAATQEGCSRDLIKNLLDQLQDYAKWHFAREEELMQAHEVPGIASHQAAHHKYVQDLNRLRFHNLKAQGLTCRDLLRFLKQWWLGHICDLDRQYGPCLNAAASREPEEAGK